MRRLFAFSWGFAAIILFALLLMVSGSSAVRAQSPTTPTAAVDVIPTLQAQVEKLEKTLSAQELAVESARLSVQRDLFPIQSMFAIAGLGSVAAAITLIILIFRRAEKQTQQALDAAVYRVNPTFMTVYISSRAEKVESRLKKLGFKDLRSFQTLGDFLTDHGHLNEKLKSICVVIDYATQIEDIERLKNFFETAKPDSEKVAFVVHAPQFIPKATDTLNPVYDSVILANSPTTAAVHVFSFARALIG
ncbi:hypothetical protein ANRL4_03451 [Anaerolineae bacterium]|nr:hypothetical protein ANRL4_03451 [Anaerolineae bacterium]